MIPITIITGYLGSGKTTLLNSILSQNHGKKIAVIENEFGEKNIDYEFVLHEKEKIYQMTNGCICCNVREDLVKTLKEIQLLGQEFDSVIVETTGLADPSPILHTLKQDNELAISYTLDSIICLVDSRNFLLQIERSSEVRKQITSANIVLINKLDQVDENNCILIEKKIKDLNPETEILKTIYSKVNLGDIFHRNLFENIKSIPKFLQKMKGEHNEAINSKYFEFDGLINQQYLSIWIDLLLFQCSEKLYRMKGILNISNEPCKVYFQCIHDYVEITKGDKWGIDEMRNNQMVVIGVDLDFELITSGFKSCVR